MELDLALEATKWTGSPSEIEALLTEETWTQRLAQWISAIRADLALICPQPVRQAEGISLSLRFIDDAEICKLNQSWREKAEPTDVLSFSALEDTVHECTMPWIEGEPVELGDIVVSIETAWRQAIEQVCGPCSQGRPSGARVRELASSRTSARSSCRARTSAC